MTSSLSSCQTPSRTDVSDVLSSTELATLASYETVIEQGLESFVEVGNALAAIRDRRLYRAEFSTFEAYCQDKWSLTRRHVNRLVAAAEVTEDVGPMGPKPTSERQSRPLKQVPKEQRAEVWQDAVESAPKDESGKPAVTAKHVQAAVDKRLGKKPQASHPPAVPDNAVRSRDPEQRLGSAPLQAGRAIDRYRAWWGGLSHDEKVCLRIWLTENAINLD